MSASSAAGGYLSVRDTFRGRHVFITGASGFLGKTLVEKILREVPDVGGLYLLIRPRKGFSVDERMRQEVVQSEIFTRLRAERGAADFDAFVRAKVHAVPGELTHENCGMTPEWRARLYASIEIIMHVAAVVGMSVSRISTRMHLLVFVHRIDREIVVCVCV
jgi:fatty acyl-CoA reductase